MTIVFKIAVFILGFYLSMRTITAFYGMIDLRYTLRTAYPRIIRNILVWSAITGFLALILGGYRHVFLWGLTAYVFIYLLSYFPLRLKAAREVRAVDHRIED